MNYRRRACFKIDEIKCFFCVCRIVNVPLNLVTIGCVLLTLGLVASLTRVGVTRFMPNWALLLVLFTSPWEGIAQLMLHT